MIEETKNIPALKDNFETKGQKYTVINSFRKGNEYLKHEIKDATGKTYTVEHERIKQFIEA